MVPENQGAIIALVRAQATPNACRRFGVTLLVGLPLAGLVWLLLLRLTADRWVWSVPVGFAIAAVFLGCSVLLAPAWGRQLYIGWHTVARMIELALTWFLLAVVYWLVITPVGLLRRGRHPSFRRPSPGAKSCWQDVVPVNDPARYYRQF